MLDVEFGYQYQGDNWHVGANFYYMDYDNQLAQTGQLSDIGEALTTNIKDNLCLAGRRTQNEKTLLADLILAGITQLITVVLSDKINHHEFIRSLKPLIA